MNEGISSFLTYYISLDDPQYAIMLNGKWGCGKTYYIKHWIDVYKEGNKGKDKVGTESYIEEIVSTVSEVNDNTISTESEIIEIATESVIEGKGTIEEDLLGAGPNDELFTLLVSNSTFTLKAVTRKSRRGGQTCVGVVACGSTQSTSITSDRYSYGA